MSISIQTRRRIPAVLGPHGRVGLLDDGALGDDAGGRTLPGAAEAPAHIGRGDTRARGMPQPLDLACVMRREEIERSAALGEPYRRSHLDSRPPECRETQVAMLVERTDIPHHAEIVASP